MIIIFLLDVNFIIFIELGVGGGALIFIKVGSQLQDKVFNIHLFLVLDLSLITK